MTQVSSRCSLADAQAMIALILAHAQRICALQMLAWQPIWRGWSRPHLQQDAQEFVHMRADETTPIFLGMWEARRVWDFMREGTDA